MTFEAQIAVRHNPFLWSYIPILLSVSLSLSLVVFLLSSPQKFL